MKPETNGKQGASRSVFIYYLSIQACATTSLTLVVTQVHAFNHNTSIAYLFTAASTESENFAPFILATCCLLTSIFGITKNIASFCLGSQIEFG